MTDEKIRDYQRKARAGDDPVAELHAWVEAARKGALPHPDSAPLVERLARGEIDRERLVLAAYAGHEGALALVGEEADEHARSASGPEAPPVVRGDDVSFPALTAWFAGLSRWGDAALAAPQVGVARLVLHAARDGYRETRGQILADVNIGPRGPFAGEPAGEGGPGLLETRVLGPAERALDAARRLIHEQPEPGDAELLLSADRTIVRAAVFPQLGLFGSPVRLALGSARKLAGARENGANLLAFVANRAASPPARAVAGAMKRAVVDFALR
jgi:hypothetical protein